MENKFKSLKEYIKSLETAAIAFSAGVDSTFLLKTAHDILGRKAVALTANSPLFPKRELEAAKEFCRNQNIKHIIIETDIENIKHNPKNRCYICKKNIFSQFIETAKLYNIKNILEGSNIDDDKDYRPGMLAVKELKIISPLKDIKLTKNEIRILSKRLNLKTADKPSFACLASRFVYDEEITSKKLEMVEKAEDFLYKKGFKQFRVRIHSNLARIEVLTDEFEKILACRRHITDEFKKYGFDYISLDLAGYKTGSMNETLKKPEY